MRYVDVSSYIFVCSINYTLIIICSWYYVMIAICLFVLHCAQLCTVCKAYHRTYLAVLYAEFLHVYPNICTPSINTHRVCYNRIIVFIVVLCSNIQSLEEWYRWYSIIVGVRHRYLRSYTRSIYSVPYVRK
jgi:hypothetical protein